MSSEGRHIQYAQSLLNPAFECRTGQWYAQRSLWRSPYSGSGRDKGRVSSLLRDIDLNRRAIAPPSHLDSLTVVRRVLAVARARRWRGWRREKERKMRGNSPIL